MQLLKNPFLLVIGVTSFVFTFVSVGKLSFFLSSPLKIGNTIIGTIDEINNLLTNKPILNALFIDGSLATIFVLLHSFLKVNWIKNLWDRMGIKYASRSIYNLFTGLTLLVSILNRTLNGSLTVIFEIMCVTKQLTYHKLRLFTVTPKTLESYSICLMGIQS